MRLSEEEAKKVVRKYLEEVKGMGTVPVDEMIRRINESIGHHLLLCRGWKLDEFMDLKVAVQLEMDYDDFIKDLNEY